MRNCWNIGDRDLFPSAKYWSWENQSVLRGWVFNTQNFYCFGLGQEAHAFFRTVGFCIFKNLVKFRMNALLVYLFFFVAITTSSKIGTCYRKHFLGENMFLRGCIIFVYTCVPCLIHTSVGVLIWDHGENYKRIRDSETIEKKLDSFGTSSQHIFNQQTTHRLWCSFITAVPFLQSHLNQVICTFIPSESLWWCNHNCATETSHPPP